jgi:hypothetical protein
MPIEIRELVIKTSVTSGLALNQSWQDSPPRDELEQEALIHLCVMRVLEILQEREER